MNNTNYSCPSLNITWCEFLEDLMHASAIEVATFYETQIELYGEIKLPLTLICTPSEVAKINSDPARKAELDGYAQTIQYEWFVD